MSVLISAMALCSPLVVVALIAGLVRLVELASAWVMRIHREEERKRRKR